MGTILSNVFSSIASFKNDTGSTNNTETKMFINDSVTSNTIASDLLKKLKNNTQYNITPGDIDRVLLNNNQYSYVVPIDSTDNGDIPTSFISTLNKYKENDITAYNTIQYYKDSKAAKLQQAYTWTPVKQSLFNPYFGVKSSGFSTNKPLLDIENASYTNPWVDTSDCSIWSLLKASSNGDLGAGLGHAIYRLVDFMYCKDLGKVSNNHLITLRRFATPVGDNIFKLSNTGDVNNMFEVGPDIGRLVTWFGTEDNKLSDILKMSFHATWREMNAEIQQMHSNEGMEQTGIMGMIANTLNPAYNKSQGAGITNSHNLMNIIGGNIGHGGVSFGKPGTYADHTALTNYDKHKIYEPKNTIQSNNYYEGKLEFSHEFTLKFSYKLRSYGNINQKSAMLDLIHNILRVTYTKGKFWGGDVKWIGPPGNNGAMKKANAFIDNTYDKLAGFAESMLSGSVNYQQLFGSISDASKNMLGAAGDVVKDIMDGNSKEMAKKYGNIFVEWWKNHNFSDAVKGQLKNTLGRPALYAINSLVSGEVLGLWHVTIGNPLNPIAAFGNLIMTNAELSFGDTPLGLDDFPTEIIVTTTLKHCKPRDMTEIGRMFTKGETGLALPLGQGKWSNYYKEYNANNINDPTARTQAINNNYAKSITKDNYSESTYQQYFGTRYTQGININMSEQTNG